MSWAIGGAKRGVVLQKGDRIRIMDRVKLKDDFGAFTFQAGSEATVTRLGQRRLGLRFDGFHRMVFVGRIHAEFISREKEEEITS